MPWEARALTGTVEELHSRSWEICLASGRAQRLVHVLRPIDRALVIGSAQPEQIVDRAACTDAGAQVVRRRSGGGAVLVEPGSMVWVDLFVPSGDPLWSVDVGRAMWWVGETWARALGASGLASAQVSKGPMLARPWSSLVCFAGVGAGEVTVAGGRKVVGISQRRARSGALFQCGCLLRWEPARLLRLLAMAPGERLAASSALGELAAGAGDDRGEEILDQLLDALPV
jgi:lipoate-protein ligase A